MSGPKPGSGDVSAYVIGALTLGEKNREQLREGSGFDATQIDRCLTRLQYFGVIEKTSEKACGRKNRPGALFRIIVKEDQIAVAIHYQAKTRKLRRGADKELDDAFARIVAPRPAPA